MAVLAVEPHGLSRPVKPGCKILWPLNPTTFGHTWSLLLHMLLLLLLRETEEGVNLGTYHFSSQEPRKGLDS